MALPIVTKTFLQLSFLHLRVAYDWCHKVFCYFLVMVFCCFSDMKKGVGRNFFSNLRHKYCLLLLPYLFRIISWRLCGECRVYMEGKIINDKWRSYRGIKIIHKECVWEDFSHSHFYRVLPLSYLTAKWQHSIVSCHS